MVNQNKNQKEKSWLRLLLEMLTDKNERWFIVFLIVGPFIEALIFFVVFLVWFKHC